MENLTAQCLKEIIYLIWLETPKYNYIDRHFIGGDLRIFTNNYVPTKL